MPKLETKVEEVYLSLLGKKGDHKSIWGYFLSIGRPTSPFDIFFGAYAQFLDGYFILKSYSHYGASPAHTHDFAIRQVDEVEAISETLYKFVKERKDPHIGVWCLSPGEYELVEELTEHPFP